MTLEIMPLMYQIYHFRQKQYYFVLEIGLNSVFFNPKFDFGRILSYIW